LNLATHAETINGKPESANGIPASILPEAAALGFSGTPTVLVVDSAVVNRKLLRGMLKSQPYRILEATRAAEAIAYLEKDRIDLVILDLMLPGMSGTELCRWLKSNRRTHLIPILIMTNLHGVENEIEGITAGASDFLFKPLSPAVVRTRVHSLLRHKAAVDSLEEAETILFALAQTVEQRDKDTGDHCQRLATYSVALGMAMNLPRPDLMALYRGGYLHDIGKIAVPDSILFKPGKLDDSEWDLMRRHTTKGEEICLPMKSLANVLPIIRSHHEKWDGSGYPDGLASGRIPLLARVLQVADIYDALTTCRPYKAAFSHEAAMEMLGDEARRGWRDPEMVRLFQGVCAQAAVGRPGLPAPPNWPDASPMQISLHNMSQAVLS
jgi:putative two-component system response regulator